MPPRSGRCSRPRWRRAAATTSRSSCSMCGAADSVAPAAAAAAIAVAAADLEAEPAAPLRLPATRVEEARAGWRSPPAGPPPAPAARCRRWSGASPARRSRPPCRRAAGAAAAGRPRCSRRGRGGAGRSPGGRACRRTGSRRRPRSGVPARATSHRAGPRRHLAATLRSKTKRRCPTKRIGSGSPMSLPPAPCSLPGRVSRIAVKQPSRPRAGRLLRRRWHAPGRGPSKNRGPFRQDRLHLRQSTACCRVRATASVADSTDAAMGGSQ